MTNSLVHRGPDGLGVWLDTSVGVGLGHRRLAIVDLTESGRQPMRSHSDRYMIVFNGEVYNFQTLRVELEGHGARFHGTSDTEVMLEAFEQWGVEEGVKRFVGMFAIALWDARERRLHLIRDRLGKKPLYYALVQGSLVFGSELKALRNFPGFAADIDRSALALYLRHNYIPSPRSIYAGVSKLPAGTLMTVQWRESGLVVEAPRQYWSAATFFDSSEREVMPDQEVIERVEELLREAVRLRMIADVPLGAFLSGGVDSSLVVALMQSLSPRPVKTFTIGFHEEMFDEAPHARVVARHLGTEHTELYLTAAEARDVIPLLPSMFDEPFADSSQIPTYLVAKMARRDVTVALSGDGGDELFCGYGRYLRWRSVWQMMQRIPAPLRSALARALSSVPVTRWDGMLGPCMRALPARMRVASPGDKLHKLAQVLTSDDPGLVYLRFLTHWPDPGSIVIDGSEPPTLVNRGGGPRDLDLFTEQMMKLDVLTYLPDDILVKVDRASMAVSLEARAPILDHRVAEFAARLPLSQKLRGSTGKWTLRQILAKYVPMHLTERPKMGFGVPIDSWLRGPLKDWAEDLLDESLLAKQGFFEPAPIRQLWRAHLDGRRDAQYLLWDVMMFQAWIRDTHSQHALKAA
jgi:asparagine synthase (glutamine-hydrolysing)